MGINKFGSFREYVRQVYEVPKDGGLSGAMVSGIILHVALVATFIGWLLSSYGSGAGLGLAGLVVMNGFFNLVPLFHSEYGAGKKLNF